MAAGQPRIGEQLYVPGGGHMVEGLVDAPVDQEHTGPWICCGDGCVLTLDVLTQFVGDHLHAQFVPQDTGTGDHGRGLR